MAAQQPSQPQHIARSQLSPRASDQVTALHAAIDQLLSEIARYSLGRSTAKEGNEEGNEYGIEELSDEDEEQEVVQGDSSAEEEEESETEEETDARLDDIERDK